jgi:uncharacterized protein YjbI with pentapeptide repeats
MTVGDLRVVAINQSSRLPTVVARSTEDPIKSSVPQPITFTVTSLPLVRALGAGNRVVLTATQHESTISLLTPQTFVTVHQLQAGPSRGPVGRLDCSDRPLQAGGSGGVPNFDNCDFTGAVLSFALLSAARSSTHYWQADFTAADLRSAGLDQAALWSAWLPGANLTGASLHNVGFFNVFAPNLTAVSTGIAGSNFFHADLARANFSGSTIADTSFASSKLAQASFLSATLTGVDLAYSNQIGADLRDAQLLPGTSYFVVDWTGANLRGATVTPMPDLPPWGLATLCHTTMPSGEVNDTDC